MSKNYMLNVSCCVTYSLTRSTLEHFHLNAEFFQDQLSVSGVKVDVNFCMMIGGSVWRSSFWLTAFLKIYSITWALGSWPHSRFWWWSQKTGAWARACHSRWHSLPKWLLKFPTATMESPVESTIIPHPGASVLCCLALRHKQQRGTYLPPKGKGGRRSRSPGWTLKHMVVSWVSTDQSTAAHGHPVSQYLVGDLLGHFHCSFLTL